MAGYSNNGPSHTAEARDLVAAQCLGASMVLTSREGREDHRREAFLRPILQTKEAGFFSQHKGCMSASAGEREEILGTGEGGPKHE